MAANGNSINEARKAQKTKASEEMILAAQLNQAREQIIQLKSQIVQQESIISQLQVENAKLEIASIRSENEKLREQYSLKEGLKFEKDKEGQWWFTEVSDTQAGV